MTTPETSSAAVCGNNVSQTDFHPLSGEQMDSRIDRPLSAAGCCWPDFDIEMESSMQDWMLALAEHYNRMQRIYPHDRLLVVFDIDGAILDMRHLVLNTLRRYDDAHATDHFARLTLMQIDVHECVIAPLLVRLNIDPSEHEEILAWYYAHYWTPEVLETAQVAFDGVMPLIRWFQRRHNTFVGLNTGRPETQRWLTLRALNRLGGPHGAYFDNRLLHMRANGWARAVPDSKTLGMRRFRNQDYRVIAMIDNEPENLAAIARIDPKRQILLMHADTLYRSSVDLLPARTVRGNRFDPTSLARTTKATPSPIEVTSLWTGSNSSVDRPLTTA